MVELSEAIGEESARLVMAKKYPEFDEIPSQLPGKGKQGQFDLVYYNKDTGEIITVEAKGGASTRGSRKTVDGLQAEQGSPEYRDSVTANMEKKIEDAQKDPRYDTNSDKYDPDFKTQVDDLEDTLDKINIAKKGKKGKKLIKSVQVAQRLNTDGSLKPQAELSKFRNTYSKMDHKK